MSVDGAWCDFKVISFDSDRWREDKLRHRRTRAPAGRRRGVHVAAVHVGARAEIRVKMPMPTPPAGMVRVPGGRFVMGSGPAEWRGRDSLAQQAVEVREFFIDATAVTNRRFREFRKATSYKTEAEVSRATRWRRDCVETATGLRPHSAEM